MLTGSGRIIAAASVLTLLAGFIVTAVWGTGYERSRTLLSGGGAWLASNRGLVTLLDGTSELVLGSVQVPVSGTPEVVQTGPSALVVDAAAGTVTRVDGATYEVSSPVRFGGGEALQVFAGDTAAYVVDGARQEASVIDPVTLQVRRKVALAATPGPGQSVVDGAGRLWVVDGGGGGLSGFGDTGEPVRATVGDGSSQLITVEERPVLLDLTRRRVGWVEDSGAVRSWSCLDVAGGGPVRLLGSTTEPRVYAAASQTGELLVADLDGDDECAAPVPVGSPGDEFGPLVEASGVVLVPNATTGRTAAVDVESRSVVADLDVLPPGGQLELLAKDGLVFYNDLAGDETGVIRLVDDQWTVGPGQRKFASGELLTPGDTEITPENPPVGLPPPPPTTVQATPGPPTSEQPSAEPQPSAVEITTPTSRPEPTKETTSSPPTTPEPSCSPQSEPPCSDTSATTPPSEPPPASETSSSPPPDTGGPSPTGASAPSS